jgi:hypothetical protein
MSIKIVVFGENEQIGRFIDKSKDAPSAASEEAIIVENVSIS